MNLRDIIDEERDEARAQGRAEGRVEGFSQGRIQNVRDMIKAGIISLEAVKASGIYTEQELAAIAAK